MKTITSVHNPEIKSIAQLIDAKYRYKQKQFIAEGVRTCATLINAGAHLQVLYVTAPITQKAEELVSPEHITEVSEQVLKKISTTSSPSGMVGVFSLPKESSFEQFSSGIVLVDVQDPGNAGALIRTCAAMEKKTVIFIGGVDPWHPKVIQASAGTIALVNIFQMTWHDVIAHKKNVSLCALVVQGGKKAEELKLSQSLLIIGNEAHGLPETVVAQCEQKLTLAMPGKTESLNAAVAGSIALYLAWHTP